MTIAVLSGKGGTGKTLVSVNLAAAAGTATYIDCDVEEPNGHLFFKPTAVQMESIAVKIPALDPERCTGCRTCVDFCRFNALAFVKNKPYLFEEVCHSCGGCTLFCPASALVDKDKTVGTVQTGYSENVFVCTGMMAIGEASGIPLIKRLLTMSEETNSQIFIDCPPGSACTVMESIKDADYCLLVAEPTVFGAQNLAMVHELVQVFDKPHGVVLNKCQEGENPSEKYCLENGIQILGRIPYDSTLGAIAARGDIAVRQDAHYKAVFTALLDAVREGAAL